MKKIYQVEFYPYTEDDEIDFDCVGYRYFSTYEKGMEFKEKYRTEWFVCEPVVMIVDDMEI